MCVGHKLGELLQFKPYVFTHIQTKHGETIINDCSMQWLEAIVFSINGNVSLNKITIV